MERWRGETEGSNSPGGQMVEDGKMSRIGIGLGLGLGMADWGTVRCGAVWCIQRAGTVRERECLTWRVGTGNHSRHRTDCRKALSAHADCRHRYRLIRPIRSNLIRPLIKHLSNGGMPRTAVQRK